MGISIFGKAHCFWQKLIENRNSPELNDLKTLKTIDRLSERNILHSIKNPFDFVYCAEFPAMEINA